MRTCYQRKQTYSFNSGARAAPQLWLAGCVDSSQLCPGARPASSYSYTSVTHSLGCLGCRGWAAAATNGKLCRAKLAGGWRLGWAALAADVRLGAASRGEERRALQTQPGKLCLITLFLYVKCAESRYCLCTIDISRQYLHNVYLQFHSLENKTSMQQCVSCQFHMPNSAQ